MIKDATTGKAQQLWFYNTLDLRKLFSENWINRRKCLVTMSHEKCHYVYVYIYVCIFHFTNITIFFNDIVLAIIIQPHALGGTHFTQVYNPDGFNNGKKMY